MALKFNQIENLLVKNKDESSLAELIISYAILKQSIEDTQSHSWYFKQGLESKKQELSTLNIHFEEMRELFNEATLDYFINKINENNLYLSDLEGKEKSNNHRISSSWKISENELFSELIRLKTKMDFLNTIEYYLENPEEFLKIFD